MLCEVFNIDGTPHSSNTRALLRPVADRFAVQESLFGVEQEYTLFECGRPLEFPEGCCGSASSLARPWLPTAPPASPS